MSKMLLKDDSKVNRIDFIKNGIGITSIFFVMFGLLGPLEIFSGNRAEFEFGFNDFFWIFFGVFAFIWLLAGIIIAFLPKKLHKIASIILATLGIEFYLQNMFFNSRLYMINGSDMDWSASDMRICTICNIIVWISVAFTIFVISYGLREKAVTVLRYIIIFLSFVQLIAVLSLLVKTPKDRVFEYECRIDATEQMAVGSDENIIVLVLDRYANDQMNINLSEHPEMKEVLKDFTYYDNANSLYETTSYGLDVLLTGHIPDDRNDTNPTWREECWQHEDVEDFYNKLHGYGFKNIFTSRDTTNVFGDLHVLDGKFDNVRDLPVTLNRGLLFRLLTKMTLYKYAPYIVKPYLEVRYFSFTDVIASVHYDETVFFDAQFYQKLLSDGFYIADGEDKIFKVQHISGMHDPYDLDENANEVSYEESNPKMMRAGLNVIMTEYLNQLKELGVYDNSTIIFTADHGDGGGEFSLQPTVMIKRKGESHDSLVIDSAPISHLDFLPTILSYIGEDYSSFGSGTTIYDWHAGDRRERSVTIEGNKYVYYTDGEELLKNAGEYWKVFE